MASPAQIAANQRNSRKSTGPSTPFGRAKSSMNALKHGNRSRKLALLREESLAFEERLRKWMAIGDAQNDVEEYLVYRNVCLSFELDRAERARNERCTSMIENSEEEELAEAHAVGRQLFFDPAGPTPLYGNPTIFRAENKTSWNGQAVDPNDPAVLVKILERTRAGWAWLRDEWRALRAQLETTGFWQSHDRLKAIRLLGRQPLEANDDRRVATIFVASHALGPGGKGAFHDLGSDIAEAQRGRYAKAVRERWPDLFATRETKEWRAMLLALADQHIDRLTVMLEMHEQNAEAHAEQTFARFSFDSSPEGEALRNYMIKCTNALFRGMANYRKYQSRTSGGSGGSGGAGGVEPRRMQDDWSAYRGREADERDGSAPDAHHAFGPGDGQDDGLKRAEVIDPDGVAEYGDFRSETGEIGENAPNEAIFDEATSFVEPREPIQVTAIPGDFSGLDNDAAGPQEDGEVEPAQSQVSGSDSGDPKPGKPESSDRDRERRSPEAVSKRKRRLKREKERRAVERIVEEKLAAGVYSFDEILKSVMALPP